MEHIRILNAVSFLTQPYLVGGCVRDMLMGETPHDYDIATKDHPDQIRSKALANEWKVIDVGAKFGSLVIVKDNLSLDVTTFRTDIENDGRHCVPAFADTIYEDLSRRDFTINAMAMGIDGSIIDPFNGQIDLRNGIIRFVGDADLRVREDYLRIIRGLRFMARYGFSVDESFHNAVSQHAPNIREHISVERFVSEVNKAFESAHCDAFLNALYEHGIITAFIPQFKGADLLAQNPDHHPEGSVWQHTVIVVNNCLPEYRWQALFHDIGKTVTAVPVDTKSWYSYHGHAEAGSKLLPEICAHLRLPNELKDSCIVVAQYHMVPFDWYRSGSGSVKEGAIRRLQNNAGKHYDALKAVVAADWMNRRDDQFLSHIFQALPDPIVPIVNGQDLIALGFKPGQSFRVMLSRAFEAQLDGETDKEILIKIAVG